jgi:hypothetical protein
LDETSLEDIEAEIKVIKISHGLGDDLELFVADVEDDPTGTITGDESLSEAFKVNDLISGLEDYELKKVNYMVSQCGYELSNAIDCVDDCDLYEDMSLKDLAYDFVDEGLFGEIPAAISNYLDYDAIARDLSYDYAEYNGDIFRII